MCGVCSCENMCCAAKLWFAAETVSAAANWHSLPSYVLCSETVIRYRNWVVCSEFVIRCRNGVFCTELVFAAELCVVERNFDSLPKLCQLQWISIRCRNWVVCSEFVIRCRNWVFYSELAFAAELCVVQRNCDSLPKLCRLQQINIRYRIVCFAANYDSLPKLCRMQRINNSLPSGVFCSELAIRCRSWVGCSEIVIRCRNCGTSSETVFAAELGSLQRTSSRCRTGCLQRNGWPGQRMISFG